MKSKCVAIYTALFFLSAPLLFSEEEDLFIKGEIETPQIAKDFVSAQLSLAEPIEVVFSRSSHNRISWDKGSIMSITGDSSLFAVEINHKIGQAFVHVLKDLSPYPATLTIVSSAGRVQDLLVHSTEKPSTHVSIWEPQEEEENFSNTYVDFHAQTIEFLSDILENKIPFGYGQRPLQENDQLNLPSPLEAAPIKALEGPFEIIVIYHLTNMGRQPIRLFPSALKRSEDSWVFLNARELAFKEHALCILAKPKQET